jgi:hypothetical protein
MFRFVRSICGCPTKEDLAAQKKQPTPRGLNKKEKDEQLQRADDDRKLALSAQENEMNAICPLSK